MSNKECRFYPVQCSDETFQTLSPQEGYVYFVTDKKKIFLGKQGSMIPMCATSGFFYGIKEIEYDNSGIMPDPNVVFYYDEIEGTDIPEEDDLILNVDGCFYRVKNVAEDGLETVRLTLQGSGVGGGGGGSTGGGSTGGSWSFTVSDGKAKTYASTATEMPIKFKANYNGTDGNTIVSVAFKLKGQDEPFYTIDKNYVFNQEHTVDIFAYKNLFNSSKTTVGMYLYDMYGAERSVSITVQIVDLELEKIKEDLIASFSDTYTYSCKLNGATEGVTEKKIIYSLYAEDNPYEPVEVWEKSLAATDEDEIQQSLNLNKRAHGVYVLKVQASARIVGSTTVLTSNTLIHKIARFSNVSNEPLLMVFIPETTEQYTNIPIQYMVITPEANKTYTMDLSLNGIPQIQLTLQSNQIASYDLYFETKGTYTLTASVIELNLVFSAWLAIEAYTGNLPVIDSGRSDLMLYLNPRNKSNDATDRDEWKDYNSALTGHLSGLHYGTANGWLMDEDNISHLKLSSGATFAMDEFRPFEKDPTKKDAQDSRMGSGMTIELDFEINGVLDYDSELIQCLSRNKDGDIKVGFCVTGDRVRFYSSRGVLLSLNLIEGKRTRVSFVIEPNTGTIDFPMVYGYLNGKIAGAVIYDVADNFKDVQEGPAFLSMDSQDAQIKIYGVRIYSTALGDRVILNNYTASLATLNERQTSYDSNNVYDSKGKVDLLKVSAETYNLQVPYMLLTGGYPTEKESKWQRKDASDPGARLPTGKKDYRMVDVEVRYPDTPYFAEYKNYKFVNTFDGGVSMRDAYKMKPNNGGAIMYAQGTSSMEYPVKNLRLRFKNEEDWYTVRPDISPVEIICMKADYMESSGSHNTGSANLIDALYVGAGMQTPGQMTFGGEGKPTVVTCVKGHPCLIFYSPTGEVGTYEYIGKYNLNLDKATPAPFGFDHSDNFGWLKEGDKYHEVLYADKSKGYKEPFCGQLEPDDGADYVPGQTETERVVGADEKVNAVHCFEFLDNAVEVCNFLGKYKSMKEDPDNPGQMIPNTDGEAYSYYETWYNTFTNKDNEQVPGWTLGFESRYPEERVGYHDADMLYPLASWLNELYLLRSSGEAGEKEALARFKNEYQCYLNKEFTLTYYLYTEALLMADSRVKNMMIATWGKENYELDDDKYSYYPLKETSPGVWEPDKTQEVVKTNNYIFYPIFYDMDTMLGLDNTGVYRFNYYDEDTNASIYNGDEVLWNFVRDALQSELKPWYSKLEEARLTASNVLPYFNDNQANLANEAFYNGDAKYKYIDPARNGYHDDLYDKDIAAGVGPYLYAAQGDRSLMREWFVTNRFKFLRGKYNSTQFKSGDRIEYRWYYPKKEDLPDEFKVGVDKLDHSASLDAVPPTGNFTFTSLKTGFAGVMVGANASEVHVERFDGEQTKELMVPEATGANGTEAYILGLSTLSDLGDLSNKYMQKFIVSSSDVRLKTLTLGNPHRDYYNPYWGTTVEGVSPKIDLSGGTYLENFNLQNCLTYKNSLNFAGCPAIQKILLTGSGVNGIILPAGGMINELRLPISVESLAIDSHAGLTNTGFSLGGYEYDESDPRIGYGSGRYINDFSKLTSLKVINTPIDTYDIVTHAGNLIEYCLRGINWTITQPDTQYCIRMRSDDLTAEQIRSYYTYDKSTQTYKLWGQDKYPTTNGVYLFEKVDMLDASGRIVCIPALEYLKTKSILDSARTAEALTGTITINVAGASVDELELYKKYSTIYPDVQILYGKDVTVDKANRISFYYIDKDTLGDGSIDDLTPYFSVLTAKNEATLADLISNSGFTNPSKSATAMWVYRFLGYWTDVESGKVYYQDEFGAPAGVAGAVAFSNHTPTADMKLVPHFEKTQRKYSIKFYGYEYPATSEPLFTIEGVYETRLHDAIVAAEKTAISKYHYRPWDDSLGEHERYTLAGWINETDYNNSTENPTFYDIDNAMITNDLKLFAFYTVENAQAVVSNLDFFTFSTQNQYIDGIEVYGTMISLSVAEKYHEIIGGKITLPSKDLQGNPITVLGSFRSNSKITDIYFLPDAEYTHVADAACERMDALRNVYLPGTIKCLGQDAFANSLRLENVNLTDAVERIGHQALYITGRTSRLGPGVEISRLPLHINHIGTRAFCNAGPRVVIKELPNTVATVGTQAFMNCEYVSINSFGGAESALQIVGHGAFAGANTAVQDVTEIAFSKNKDGNWPTLEKGGSANTYATFSLGYPKVTSLIIGKDMHDYESTTDLIIDLFNAETMAAKVTVTEVTD